MSDGRIVYVAGEDWDAVEGTDRHLASALAETSPVLWVDPVESALAQRRRRRRGRPEATEPLTTGLHWVSAELTRLHVVGLPGVTRPVARDFGRRRLDRAVSTSLEKLRTSATATILSDPIGSFPTDVGGRRLFYVTDDWLGGAPLLGLTRRHVHQSMRRSLDRAHRVLTVSDHLADIIRAEFGFTGPIDLIPNGCSVPSGIGALPDDLPRGVFVALVGQLNERLDYDVLDTISEAGIDVMVIGPRTERSAHTAARLDSWLGRSNVHWLGRRPSSTIPRYLRSMNVGITPYVLDEFNSASFPLKTLEYLASGLQVVSANLPAAHWLATEHVVVAQSPAAFSRRVASAVAADTAPRVRLARQDFARGHSWHSRAESVLRLVDGARPRPS